MKRIIYSIQGNIGSGKSTLLKCLLKGMPKAVLIPEPVQNWQNVGQYNLLNKYYENPQRWGYTFQINCILSRFNQLSKTLDTMKYNNVYISQRSVQSDKFIFAKLMHKLKKLDQMQYYLYLQMFKSLENLFDKHSYSLRLQSDLHTTLSLEQRKTDSKVDGYFKHVQQKHSHQKQALKQPNIIYRQIYLKTSPQKCFQRIRKRNRFQQKNLQLDYIKQIHNLHQQWLVKDEKSRQENLVIDGYKEFQTDQQRLKEIINQIKRYIVENNQFDTTHLTRNNQEEIKNLSEQIGGLERKIGNLRFSGVDDRVIF